jgi:predicted Zn-dependent protease
MQDYPSPVGEDAVPLQADSFALEHMKRTGISPKHFVTILERLEAALGGGREGGFRYLASHPPTSERIHRFKRE